jgi:hypothetical protein
MTRVRPPRLPTLKKCTSFEPLSFCGVWVVFALFGEEGTSASIWYAKRDWEKKKLTDKHPG